MWYALILLLLFKSISYILGNLCGFSIIANVLHEMRSLNLLQQIIWIVWSQTLSETYWIRVYTSQWIFFPPSIHSEGKDCYIWILPSFCWTGRIISWFRRYQKHWTSSNSNEEGYILSTLYELNLTAMWCVLYLSLRFLGCTTNLQYATGRYFRGNLVPALTEHPPLTLGTR